MKLNEAFTKRVEYYLAKKGISLYKFAKDSCIPRSTITNMSNGHTKSPTLFTIYQVAEGLGVSVLEFLDCELFKNVVVE